MYSRLQELTEIEDFEVGDSPVSFFDFVGVGDSTSKSINTTNKDKHQKPVEHSKRNPQNQKDFSDEMQTSSRFFENIMSNEQGVQSGNVQVLYNQRTVKDVYQQKPSKYAYKKEGNSSQRKSLNSSISFQQRKFSKDVKSMMDIFKK